ncbi:MAG TPA: VTT domain-containing protein [Patescibacteria group bacterium]|nr:VTT domain-containing protein [Patescibacteria group bacterium]
MSFFTLSFTELIPALGYIGITAIIFAESGLLIGFFLPGDSLLFTAGFLASQHIFDIKILTILSFIAAVLGDSVGYLFGQKVGKKLFQRKDSLIFHKDHLIKARQFYEKHGKKTIVLARFLPIIRTFAPIVAGMGDMKYSVFIVFNIVGGMIWAVGLTLAGYFLGNLIPDVDTYLFPIVIGIIMLSVSPHLIHIIKNKKDRIQLIRTLVKLFRK